MKNQITRKYFRERKLKTKNPKFLAFKWNEWCVNQSCNVAQRFDSYVIKTQVSPGSTIPSSFYRLPVGHSLFYYKGGPAKCDAKRGKHYCTCKEHPGHRPVVDCRFKSLAAQPKYVQGTKGWKDLNFPGRLITCFLVSILCIFISLYFFTHTAIHSQTDFKTRNVILRRIWRKFKLLSFEYRTKSRSSLEVASLLFDSSFFD